MADVIQRSSKLCASTSPMHQRDRSSKVEAKLNFVYDKVQPLLETFQGFKLSHMVGQETSASVTTFVLAGASWMREQENMAQARICSSHAHSMVCFGIVLSMAVFWKATTFLHKTTDDWERPCSSPCMYSSPVVQGPWFLLSYDFILSKRGSASCPGETCRLWHHNLEPDGRLLYGSRFWEDLWVTDNCIPTEGKKLELLVGMSDNERLNYLTLKWDR